MNQGWKKERLMFENAYADKDCAAAYAELQFPGTYYLAFRDLPAVFRKHVKGTKALDFGCGAGRSTRFLREHGFENVVGIDISNEMISKARELDPPGDYRVVNNGDLSSQKRAFYDLIFCAFPFDNIPNGPSKVALFAGLRALLNDTGRLVVLGSTPEIYVNEWASFSTVDFPENRLAKDGDIVRIVNIATTDRRPVEDIRCSDQAYRQMFYEADLDALETLKPLAHEDEPYSWGSETRIAPWVIYVLRQKR